jgi:radical SAM protein with 4Fe4S-binding SPASM domain
VAGRRLPVSVTVELTRRCPLTCSHCYNNLPMADPGARRTELTTDEHRRILDELAQAGCLWLLFTGGEILARHDFLDIYRHAKRKGFIVTLFTNATLVTEHTADALVEWRPFAIDITLYGRTRETYERLTRIPGSYDRCLRGIRLLKERGLPVSLKTVAVSVNRHEVWEMKRFAEEELGVPFKFDAMMTPRIDCSQSPIAVRLTPEEIVELDLRDPGRMQEWGEFSRDFIRPQQPRGKEQDVYHCGGGVNSFAIDPLGRMSICVLSHQEEYDLRHGTVAEGWDRFLSAVRDKKISRVTKCTACQLKSVCGMCPANAELEAGDPETPVDFLCHVAHLRALTFGWPIPPHGRCEYCEGGERHEDIARSAAALRGGEVAPRARRVFLTMAAEPGGPGGCGSCRG